MFFPVVFYPLAYVSPPVRVSLQSLTFQRSESSSRRPPLFLRLQNGPEAAASWVEDGVLPGEYTTRSFGECPSEENVSRLSAILEDTPHQKYYLSAKACQGILNRAERRGKKLPEQLETALRAQAALQIADISLET